MNKATIATREYFVLGDPEQKIIVEIFAPEIKAENKSWSCQVKVHGAENGLDQLTAGGDDSFQALILALSMLESVVERINTDLGGKLRYGDESGVDLGLRMLD